MRLENEGWAGVVSILYIWSDLAHVKIEKDRNCQILSGVYKELSIFLASLAMDRLNEFHLKSGVNLCPNRLEGISLSVPTV